MKKEFKVEIIKEGALGTILLGSSKLPLKKMESVMNQYGEQGWDVSFFFIYSDGTVEKRIILE